LGSDPIREAQPAGESVRYDPTFEQLQAEVRKLESMSGDTVDWENLVLWGGDLLANKTKDMLVAAYFSLGAFHQMGYPGLAACLTAYRDLITTYWEPLFPERKRMRGRVSAVIWLTDRLGKAVSQKKPVAADGEHLHTCEERIKEIVSLLQEKMEGDFPGMGDLRDAVRDRLEEIRKSEVKEKRPEPAETSAAPGAPPASSIQVTGSAEEIGSDKDAESALRDVRTIVQRATAVLRAANPGNPLPYRLLRTMIWSTLNEIPPHQNQKTRLPPVPSDMMQRFQGWLDGAEWALLLEEAEMRFGERMLWLDVHFFADRALAGMGHEFQGARDAVQQETSFLLLRLPGLEDLCFEDGTPFAGPQTRMWVQKELLPRWGGGADGGGASASLSVSEEGPLKEILEQVDEIRSSGKFEQAVALLQKGLRSLSSGRERFRCRMELAKLCLDAGKATLAAPQLDELQEDVGRYSVDAWEPALCVDLLQTHIYALDLLGRDKAQKTPELLKKKEDLRDRLCRIDMTAALNMKKS